MADADFTGFSTLGEFLNTNGWTWPGEWFGEADLLSQVYVLNSADRAKGQQQKTQMWLMYEGEQRLSLPGLEMLALVLLGEDAAPVRKLEYWDPNSTDPFDRWLDPDLDAAPESEDLMFIYAEYVRGQTDELQLPGLTLAARIDNSILRSVSAEDSYVDVLLNGTVRIGKDYDLRLDSDFNASLAPATIADSGIVVWATEVKLDLMRTSNPPEVTADGFDDTFVGIYIGKAGLELPEGMSVYTPDQIVLDKAAVGSGGVSGTASATYSPEFDSDAKSYSGPGAGTLFGVPFGLKSLSLTIKKNAFVSSSITAEVLLPYFDKRVNATFGFDGRGGLTMQVTGVVEPKSGDGYDSTTGLLSLSLEGVGVFTIKSLGLEVDSGKASFRIGAAIKPTVGGLAWPSFEIRELVIDSDGNVRVEGGWIDLPKQLTLDLHGFAMELTKIGFGIEDDGQKWIGFSGGIKLVDGLQAGASVKGLRVLYGGGKPTSLSLEGVAINLEIKNTLLIAGEVAFNESGKEFRGAVKLALPKLNFEFDGQFVAGTSVSGEKYFAIYVHTELPAGLPLGNTGLALFGAAGLYAHRMVPNKTQTQGWYENPDYSNGWYLQSPVGVEQLSKWRYDSKGMAFGAGVTIGTFADNGYEFNGRLLLVLVFPGPIIILEGKANLFKQRAALAGGGEPMFRALAILDPSQSFLVDMDARFKYKADDGKLIDLHGSTEAYFNFDDPEAWHIWIGRKDDKKRRVGGTIFKLFNVDSYFQLSARQLDVGSSWSFDKSYGFSHLNVHVAASFAEDGSISWHPAHFSGSMSFQGRAELRAFGCGVGLNVGTKVTGEVFSPYNIKGSFHVGIDFPWPMPDVGGTINLEWKEEMKPTGPLPLLPLPLQEASAELPNRSLRWPFRRGTNLVPNNDQGEAEFPSPYVAKNGTGTGAPLPTSFDFSQALCVPVDAQLGLAFGRPVDDPWSIGGANPQNKVVADVVGDPVNQDITKVTKDNPLQTGYAVAYTLSSVVLEKVAALAPGEKPGAPLPANSDRAGWVLVARRDKDHSSADVLFGAWTPAGPTAMPKTQEAAAGISNVQSKLMLGAKSPFDYTGLTSQSWEEWFTQQEHPNYPCTPPKPNEKLVDVFEDPVGTHFPNRYDFADPAFGISWEYGGDIAAFLPPIQGVEGETIDRGLTIDPRPSKGALSTEGLEKVEPPAGLSEVDIRVGIPDKPVGYMRWGRFSEVSDPQEVLNGALTITAFKYAEDGSRDYNVPPAVIIFGSLQFQYSISLLPVESAFVVGLDFVPLTSGPSVLATVEIFDSAGNPILDIPRDVPSNTGTVRIAADGISEIVVTASSSDYPPYLKFVLVQTPVRAVAESSEGMVGPFTADPNGLIKIKGINLRTIYLGAACGGQFLILELAIPSRRVEVIQQTIDALQRFNEAGPVFEPETNYRLTITTQRDSAPSKAASTGPVKAYTSITEQVYFRTAALPGIGIPDLPAGTQNGTGAPTSPLTGFEDLGFYVKRTVPAVPPPEGGHKSPARAVYRAYDQSVEHSEDTSHVELMYRLGRRDLTLRLFDGNSQPLRDTNGRVLVAGSHWDQSADPTISASTKRWIDTVNGASCLAPNFSTADVVRSEVLSAPSEDVALKPAVLHQARLVPMLLHEAFVNARVKLVADGSDHQFDRWAAEQYDTHPSKWQVHSETVTPPGQDPVTTYFVREDNKVVSALTYKGPLASLQNTSHPDYPGNWSDLQASVQLRWAAGEVGLDVRRSSPNDFIRVLLNRDTNGRQLQASVAGQVSVLAEDVTTFPSADSDLVLTVVCEGDRVQVFQHAAGETISAPIFDVEGAPTTPGTVALISMAADQPRFTEIAVHDLRPNPSTAFRFDFITSRYTNFYHHLHSSDDQLLAVPSGGGISKNDFDANKGAAIDIPASPSSPGLATVQQDEARAFDNLEEAALHGAKLLAPERIEILRANQVTVGLVLMVRSPEPLLWERTQLVISKTSPALVLGIPAALKLAGVAFGGTPIDESVTIEVRDPASLEGCTIEWRMLPDATTPDPVWSLYYEFLSEHVLADGTTVQIFSGDATQAPVRRPGMAQRFVAADASTAVIHFPSGGVELRLLGPAGTVLHQRQFLPSSSYSAVAMRAIRKQDGTALFLFAPDGTDLSNAGTLQLALTFSRDLGAAMAVLGQAGDRSPEVVVVHVPIAGASTN